MSKQNAVATQLELFSRVKITRVEKPQQECVVGAVGVLVDVAGNFGTVELFGKAEEAFGSPVIGIALENLEPA